MKKSLFGLIFIAYSLVASLQAQDKFTLSGTVTDNPSNETLIGVNIIFPEIQSGTMTNEYGFYSITLPKGTYTIQISYLGFKTITEKIDLNQNLTKNYIMVVMPKL